MLVTIKAGVALAAAALATLSTASTAGAVAATSVTGGDVHQLVRGGVTATVNATSASLGNAGVTRRWVLVAGGTQTASVTAPVGRSVVQPAPDFRITIDGVSTSSTSGWHFDGAEPVRPQALPGRPTSGGGAALRFHYSLVSDALAPAIVELVRTVTLHPGSTVFETTSTLISHGLAARVSSYTLDQVDLPPRLAAQTIAFHGGSDWRDDYRETAQPAGAFDREGEVVRFGGRSGIFLVAQRRSGSMSRVGRDSDGRAWAGVDWPRDGFDFGPLKTDPPDYNRLDNPAYPVPIRSRLLPAGGTLDLGTAYLGTYSGGPDQAAAAFTGNFVGADEPMFRRTVGLNSFHPWGHGPGMSDANLRKQVRVAKQLGVETFMLDDQWQGGAGGESGDWNFDPARFPDRNRDGVPDFVSYLHRQGLSLGLWMSPLEFNQASHAYGSHPGWACAPIGDVTARDPDDAGLGVWDATNPQFQRYLLGVVNRLVRAYQVRELKFDFMAWVDCGGHDYADYEAAFVDLVHRMQAAHPHVTFELDETNDQRAWPFESAQIGPSWFDNGHLHGNDTAVAKLLHDVWDAAPWVPPQTLGVGLDDGTLTGPYSGVAGVDFLFPLAMLTHVTFWTDLRTLSPAQRAETAWWIRWYRAHRSGFGAVTYELTRRDPLGGKGWAAWQQTNGSDSTVFAFRQSGGGSGHRLRLEGLDPAASYRVGEVRTGDSWGRFTGRQLGRGLRVRLETNAAIVLAVHPIR
jgi:hypothetical protein